MVLRNVSLPSLWSRLDREVAYRVMHKSIDTLNIRRFARFRIKTAKLPPAEGTTIFKDPAGLAVLHRIKEAISLSHKYNLSSPMAAKGIEAGLEWHFESAVITILLGVRRRDCDFAEFYLITDCFPRGWWNKITNKDCLSDSVLAHWKKMLDCINLELIRSLDAETINWMTEEEFDQWFSISK